MKILLLSFYNLEYNGRTRELINSLASIGELFTITKSNKRVEDGHDYCFVGEDYFHFLRETRYFIRKLKKEHIDVLVIDDRKAIIPSKYAKRILKPRITVLDCRELYVLKDVHHIRGKIGCLIEKPAIKRADIIICANPERADFMVSYYKLTKRPISFENVRKLEYSSTFKPSDFAEKYRELFNSSEIRVIETAGCQLERKNDVLVRNMNKVDSGIRLIIVGESTAKDRQIIENIIASNNLSNVTILGRLMQDELKYVCQNCHIGIVNYHQDDFNNKYCASGKLYEFVFDGLPVVTTTNPPLSNICQNSKIGISDDDFYNGINQVAQNYDTYKQNVIRFAESCSDKENNKKLSNELKKAIAEIDGNL